ncbi:Plasmodium exported protein, unknown function [Plasmodium vivax]|uniref:Variable surface protein n=1 Tax=Plasmodium vivax TaxID=5855 RepID=A0A565A6B1_PLAVI|nr:Plasmodium exported protein, unknown function [Plasmodium vivax]
MYFRKEIMMNISILQIYTFVLLSWIYKYYRYEYNFGKTLENGNKLLMLEDIRTLRSLAKYELRNELKNIAYDDDNHKYVKEKRNSGTYAKLKEHTSHNFEDYKKNMNSRLKKKKGIMKLDCYCENKIFNSMDKFDKLVENMNSNKGIINKILFKKFGLRIIFTFLFATSGIIFIVLDKTKDSANNNKCLLHRLGDNDDIIHMISALFFIIGIIFFLVCIYLLIKTIKYEGIKRGTRKMKPKEYFYLFKESFSTKRYL